MLQTEREPLAERKSIVNQCFSQGNGLPPPGPPRERRKLGPPRHPRRARGAAVPKFTGCPWGASARRERIQNIEGRMRAKNVSGPTKPGDRAATPRSYLIAQPLSPPKNRASAQLTTRSPEPCPERCESGCPVKPGSTGRGPTSGQRPRPSAPSRWRCSGRHGASTTPGRRIAAHTLITLSETPASLPLPPPPSPLSRPSLPSLAPFHPSLPPHLPSLPPFPPSIPLSLLPCLPSPYTSAPLLPPSLCPSFSRRCTYILNVNVEGVSGATL
jgi:hypothetical protein